MRDPDQQFFDTFMLVVGILIGFTVAIFVLATHIAGKTQNAYVLEDPTVIAGVNERIAPLGSVVLAGSEELAAAREAAQAADVVVPEISDVPLTGEQVYSANPGCATCHAPPGVAGAPALGDQAAWAERVAKGMDTLIDHAINGFTGSAGAMPAKGGRPDFSDEEVIAAVEYMLEQLD